MTRRTNQWRRLSRLAFFLAAICLGLAGLSTGRAQPAGSGVLELSIDGVINPLAADYFERGVAQAEREGYHAVLLTLNTPGGLDASMREMTDILLNPRIPIITYVAPPGARAASAGLFIVLASPVAAMAPGTNIGAAHPVSIGGGEVDETTASKIENDAAAMIRAIAAQRGRNAEWAERGVRESVSATAAEAVDLNLIDLVSPNRAALLEAVDGRTVQTVGGPVMLQTAGQPVTTLPMNAIERLLDFLSDPNVAYILMTIGVLGILGEIAHPGTYLPGTVGLLAIILAFLGLGNLPFNAAGIALILAAFVLLVIDFLTQGLGALSIGSLVAFVLGSLILFRPLGDVSPVAPALEVHPALIAVTTLLLAVGVGWALQAIWRARRSPPTALVLTELTGQKAVTATPLAPRGQVKYHGERWLAISEAGEIPVGQRVEIVRAEGLELYVRPYHPEVSSAAPSAVVAEPSGDQGSLRTDTPSP